MMMAWKARWLCTSREPTRTASSTGFREPAAKGATVSGTRPAAMSRSKVQWYDPWDGLVSGTGAGSFTMRKICVSRPLSAVSDRNFHCFRDCTKIDSEHDRERVMEIAVPVPLITSASQLATNHHAWWKQFKLRQTSAGIDIRGPGGSRFRLLEVWKAATRIESRKMALRIGCLEKHVGAPAPAPAARRAAVARAVCRSRRDGRTIEAMLRCQLAPGGCETRLDLAELERRSSGFRNPDSMMVALLDWTLSQMLAATASHCCYPVHRLHCRGSN